MTVTSAKVKAEEISGNIILPTGSEILKEILKETSQVIRSRKYNAI